MRIKRLILPATAMIGVLLTQFLITGCNSKTDPIEEEEYVRNTELIVTKFSLKSDLKVMKGLDSVYFAIDLQNGIIYNADSLPMGTPVNKLIPVISYSSSAERVQIIQQGKDADDHVVTDYIDKPNDTIDFTKKVTLEMATAGSTYVRTYLLKVNVHKMNPDSLDFNVDARMGVPSRLSSPRRQRTVSRDGKVYMMIEENDGSRTLSVTADMAKGEWTKTAVPSASALRVETMSAAAGQFYMLDGVGRLFSSPDGLAWNAVPSTPEWSAIIGGFGDVLQGIRHNGTESVHTQYPLNGYAETPLEPAFPRSGFSDMHLYTTKWSSTPLGLITGGQYADGVSGDTWAFDGTTWLNITDKGMPGVYGGVMIPYFAYLRTGAIWLFNEYSIWLYIGGSTADGKPNKKVYMSYDNGVHWSPAPGCMQLPEAINSYKEIGYAVMDTPLEADFSPESWRSLNGKTTLGLPKNLSYNINGYLIEWNCPYIYLIGGYTDADSGHISPWIYRGVINRMRFKPLI